MVSAAQTNQIFELVLTADCARDEMVHVDPCAVSTPAHDATSAIPAPNPATQGGWNRLCGTTHASSPSSISSVSSVSSASRHAVGGVSRIELLRIALTHFDHLRSHFAARAVAELS